MSQDIRRISHGLNPITLALHGLLKALEEEIYSIESANNDILIEFEHSDQFKEPESIISETIYFTVLEILENILKHAETSFIHLNINQLKDKYHLTIENDGKTFNVDTSRHNGIGLVNIISRIRLLGDHIFIKPDTGGKMMKYEIII